MSQTPGDQEPTTALRHLHADTPRNGTLTLTLRRKSAHFVGRIQAVDATAGGLDGLDSSSSRASAGVFQPSVLRGRVLSLVAT